MNNPSKMASNSTVAELMLWVRTPQNERKNLTVRIGMPHVFSGNWVCHAWFSGFIDRSMPFIGVTSLQALGIALQGSKSILDGLLKKDDLELHYGEEACSASDLAVLFGSFEEVAVPGQSHLQDSLRNGTTTEELSVDP